MNNNNKDIFSILNSNAYIHSGIIRFNHSKYRVKIYDLDSLIYNLNNLPNISGVGKTTMNTIYQILEDNGCNITNKNKDIETFGEIINNDDIYNLICRYNLYLKHDNQNEIISFSDLYSLILNNELLDIISNNIDMKVRDRDIIIYNKICNILIKNKYDIKCHSD